MDVGSTRSGARSLRELSEDLERSRGDVSQLERLRDELEAQKSNMKTGVLRLRVISALVAARKPPTDAVAVPPRVTLPRGAETMPLRSHDLTVFLGARNLTAPDRQYLYLYRVTDDEMSKLRTALEYHAKSGRLDRPTMVISAQFVLFAAEWFRRSFAGGSYSWDGIVTDIAATLSPEERSVLVEHGLAWWGRPLRRSAAGYRQFLLSCVLEGGFPTRLLESREHGWLGVHLRRLVNLATAMREPGRAEALSGHVLRDLSVPEGFRKDEFRWLCVDFAIAIVDLRREVQGLPVMAGDRASLILDRHRPEWRQDLPLVIEGAGAERLLDDLLSAPIETFGGNEARCWRLLVRISDSWHPALRLSAEGPIAIPPAFTRGTARLRATPVGRLADDIRGEIALLDPPGAEGPWLARPRPAVPRAPIRGYPFDAAVDVELRCESEIIGQLRWKGGEPLRGDVLTFFDEGGGETGRVLTFVGSGSCRARHSPLYVLASTRHVARTAEGHRVTAEWTGNAGQLFRLDVMSYVGVPGDDELFYRIEPGAVSERTLSLGLDGTSVKGLTSLDGDDVYAGPPKVLKMTSGTQTDARRTSNEVYWRHQDRAEWHDVARRNIESGAIELVWRDTQSRAAHDRRRLAVLPADTKLNAVALPAARASFTLEHAGSWVLGAAESADLTVERQGPSLHIGWVGTPRRSVDFQLDAPGHSAITVRAPFPLQKGAFVGADGCLLLSETVMTLDQLRGARAIVGNQGDIRVEPRGGNMRWSQIERFSLEYSLWSLRDELEALLSELSELDAEAILTVEPGGDRLRVRRYEMRFGPLEATAARLERSFPSGLQDIVFGWRSLIDMGESGGRSLVPLDLGEDGCALPIDLSGPGVVYARRNGALAVRPTLVDRPPVPSNESTPLQAAVLITGSTFRSKAISERLNAIAAGAPDADADLAWMHALLAVPDGLPPTTFEVLQALSSCPGAAIALIFAASDEAASERVWRLEQALPFLWVLCSVDAWRSGHDAAVQRLSSRLAMAGFTADEAIEMARSSLANLIDRMIHFDEALVAPCRFAGLTAMSDEPVRDAREIAQDRIRRGAGLQDTATPTTCFDLAFLGAEIRKLAPWRFARRDSFAFDQSHWQGLDAPLSAALAAAGWTTPTSEQRLAMRQARREDPQHFCEAYAAAICALARLSSEPTRS